VVLDTGIIGPVISTERGEGPDQPDQVGPATLPLAAKVALGAVVLAVAVLTILLFFTDVIWSAGDDAFARAPVARH
jgi:hypothetical protein